jgi:membrane-bound serine protease (ClpP class)
LGSLPIFNRLVLAPPVDPSGIASVNAGGKKGNVKPLPPVHPDVSVGDWGRADSQLRPAGRASFAGKSFDVVSDGSFVEPGRQVKVIGIQGYRIVVSPVDELET